MNMLEVDKTLKSFFLNPMFLRRSTIRKNSQ